MAGEILLRENQSGRSEPLALLLPVRAGARGDHFRVAGTGRSSLVQGRRGVFDQGSGRGRFMEERDPPPTGAQDQVTDTCFAILFLKRATPPLQKPKDIATGVAKRNEEPET